LFKREVGKNLLNNDFFKIQIKDWLWQKNDPALTQNPGYAIGKSCEAAMKSAKTSITFIA